MAITAFPGPLVGFGIANVGSSIPSEYNEERGPTMWDLGSGISDPRPNFNYEPGQKPGSLTYMFWDNIGVINQIPSSAQSKAIASSQAVSTAGTAANALTLNTSVGPVGIGYGISVLAPETGKNVTMAIAIDYNAPQFLTYGSAGTVAIWNPSNAIARNITVNGTTTSSQDDSNATATVVGRDVYGFKMTETFSLSSLSQTAGAAGQKAFKYVNSITISASNNSTSFTAGWGNIVGLPMRADNMGFVYVTVATSNSSAWYIGSSGATFIKASTTTQTSTTTDVRGTYTSSTVYPGTSRLIVTVAPNPANLIAVSTYPWSEANAVITSTNFSGLFGLAQFSSI